HVRRRARRATDVSAPKGSPPERSARQAQRRAPLLVRLSHFAGLAGQQWRGRRSSRGRGRVRRRHAARGRPPGGAMARIYLYDTTLRDGTQWEGISLSVDDKLKIAAKLDEFQLDYIEGGWPGSNPKDAEFFRRVPELGVRHARMVAFGSTRHANRTVDEDQNIRLLVEAATPAVALVSKSWDMHVTEALRITLEQNLDMIRDSVGYLKELGREVIYDAEHFFDAYKANRDYALETVRVAAGAGADVLVLCDTNGGSLPWEIEEITRAVAALGLAPLGIHTHNDSANAVANALAAV